MKQRGRKNISTVKQIEALKPRDDRYEIPDSTVRGLRLVVFPTGKMSWVFRFRFGGRTRKLTLECGATDLARARKLAGDAMHSVSSKVDPGAEKQERKRAGSPLTVERLIDKYAKEHLGKVEDKQTETVTYKLGSGREVERVLRKELKPYLNRQADGGISSHEAVTLIKSVGDRGLVIRNRTLTHLKTLYRFGMGVEVKACTSSPFEGLELKDEGDGRERVLSKMEIKAVWAAAEKLGEPYTSIVRLLVLTGLRLEQIGHLRWSEVDLEERKITKRGTSGRKNGKAHIVALSDPSVAILTAVPRIKNDHDLVFTLTGGPIVSWQKMRDRLYEAVITELGHEPEQWQPHDLRRTLSTKLVEDLKINHLVADKVIGHSAIVKGVAKVYMRAELLDERKYALEAWGRYVEALVSDAPSNVVQLRT